MTTFPDPTQSTYVNLVTFRLDGREVPTPVWIAPGNNRLYVFSAGNAGKVKRVRATGRIRFAPCDASGHVTGEWFEGQARVIEDDSTRKQALLALHKKYGWRMTLADLFAKLTGRFHKRAYLEITLSARATITVIGVGLADTKPLQP